LEACLRAETESLAAQLAHLDTMEASSKKAAAAKVPFCFHATLCAFVCLLSVLSFCFRSSHSAFVLVILLSSFQLDAADATLREAMEMGSGADRGAAIINRVTIALSEAEAGAYQWAADVDAKARTLKQLLETGAALAAAKVEASAKAEAKAKAKVGVVYPVG
jgi:hypothetical protein